ncbi:MAG TPA: asparagine synthase (glutamine-hydrolyzing) [Solirubrobacterales bacterium]|jgi:asparagine synthase (glutamine-hydrolysing)|nr:asparagine synthase (glutamine-hydrolyzing) [Solirubrobacterales bacterium]
MCGIVGTVRRNGEAAEPALLERMCAALEHRGPDQRGIHADGPVGLGIQRLRVVDLEGGDQPIYNEDRSVAVVLNGEIYNFRELRRRLEAAGHRFATDGDTETIVHLYEEEGLDCVRSLDGMFAFALWDARRRRLLIARDRVGKKPLFYALGSQGLSFASELRALVQDEEIPREVDEDALDCYLAYGYVPAPLSIFRAVRKLPPATAMVYEGGDVSLERYWQLDYARKHEVEEASELHAPLLENLRGAVRKRLVSDVPLGAFLSGGIDSSAVVAAMAQETSEPVKTFSIGFDDERFDELAHARAVAELFGTEHEELQVRPDAIEIAPRIARHYGEPFADSSAVPSFYLAGMTRRHVTVALNGDGGDESFAGYTRYAANVVGGRLERIPAPLRRLGAGLAARLPESAVEQSPRNRLRRLGGSLALDGPARYERYVSLFDREQRQALYGGELSGGPGGSQVAAEAIAEPWREASGEDRLDVLLEVDVRTYLPGDLLTKIDIATMAHSLEARSPFLDPQMMQFAASIPAPMKLRGMEKKRVLRDALRAWLPDSILDRPKQGFSVPLAAWLRSDLREYSRELLLDRASFSQQRFRQAAIEALLDEHGAGRDHSQRIWALLMLELWQTEVAAPRPAALVS